MTHQHDQDDYSDIRDAVAKLCAKFPGEYWRRLDRDNAYPSDFVKALAPHGLDQRFAHVAEQRGMFSFTGLKPEHVEALRDKHSIYMVKSGRANVAGLSGDNLDYVCNAIADVVK